MELKCKKCGYKRQLGETIGTKEVFVCTECQSTDMTLVDTSGMNITVNGMNGDTVAKIIKSMGVNENTVVEIVKGLAKNINVYDIFAFLAKQGGGKDNEK